MTYSHQALALTADEVLNKLSLEQRFSYVAGVVEGLAQSRWLIDRPDQAGHDCIFDWYYNGGEKRSHLVDTWFKRHPDKNVGALLYVLIKKDCGELIGSTE